MPRSIPDYVEQTGKQGIAKAEAHDFFGRFREIVMDPLNLLILRDPRAGTVEDGLVWLHNGNRVPVAGPGAYYGNFSDILIINRGVHEPLEEYIFQEVLRQLPQEPVMVELGAYWGHYSMWLKREHPAAKVFMVEPDPENMEAGQGNFERHGFDGTFIQAFVGKDNFQIDPFMKEHALQRLHILHADIQGFELEMLEGCRESLRQGKIDHIFVSTHSQDLHHRVVAMLVDAGMRIEASADFENESTSFDGLVFATRSDLQMVFQDLAPLGRRDLLAGDPSAHLSYLLRISNGAAPR